ncbi:MAG: hypothetical protein HQM08_27295 [Candidatus Riflebacteria bacterium]|nr:hypothetical protein [Candidatus Riflebacteria bacterium]
MKVTIQMTETDHRLLKAISLLDKKPMSRLVSEWIRKTASKKEISSDISELGKRLLAMPITEEEVSEETMRAIEEARKESDAGTLEDLEKKYKICR